MRLNRTAINARPFTRPDCLASIPDPVTRAPAGRTVVFETTTDLASRPSTGSSTRLVLHAGAVSSVIESGVSAGTVISRNRGAGGAAGAGAGAAAFADSGVDGAAAAGGGAPAGAAADVG